MQPQQVLSTDQLRLNVDAYARFRIIDPVRMVRTAGTPERVKEQLEPILTSVLRQELGKRTFQSLLTAERGQAMQKAVPVGVGAMAALLGLDLDQAEAIVREAAAGEIAACANDNGPGQVVISGHKGAVERAIQIARDKFGKKAMLLPVSAPFHCPLMQPAADAMAEALSKVTLAPPKAPVVNNVTATASSDPETLRKRLVEQVTGLVRWRETVLFMKQAGVDEQVELGAGKVLAGLVKRIDKDIRPVTVGTPAEIEAFLKAP